MIAHKGEQAVTVRALRGAAPYIHMYKGKVFVIKTGGGAFRDVATMRAFIEQVAILHHLGIRVVLVHGGGPQLDEIAAVDGVDGVFIGPADLSASMGHVGEFTHPAVMQAMGDAAQRCKDLGKPVGTIGATPEVVTQYRAMGYDYLAISSDMGLMMSGALAAVKALRGLSDEPHVHSLQTGTQTEA